MDSSSNPNPYSYSLPGKALKLDSKDDIQPYLDEINKLEKLQEIHVGGHTLGVEASKALADVLREKKELQVSDKEIQKRPHHRRRDGEKEERKGRDQRTEKKQMCSTAHTLVLSQQ